MDKPLVSVVMSVFNAEKYLAEAIESILNQTFQNFEFIIINDGSTDSSLDITENYQKQDVRIILISRENRGLVTSLNEGIKRAKGKYIARMDADDIAMPTRLKDQVQYMEIHIDVGICGTGAIVFGEDKKEHEWILAREDKTLQTQLLFSSPLIHPSVMMRRDLVMKHKLFYHKDFIHAEDFELWTRFAEVSKLANLNTPLLKYRILKNSASREADKNQEQRYEIITSITKKYINKLDIKQNDSERHLHFLLSANVHMQTEEIAFDVLEAYYGKILTANRLKKLFQKVELKKVLGKKWLWNALYRKNVKALFSTYTLYGIWSILSK